MVNPIPEEYATLTPMFTFKDGRTAIDFYRRAFGAEERFVLPGPDGKGILHAELRIGSSIVMVGEENPRYPSCRSAASLGGSPVGFYVYVANVDQALQRAVEAGAQLVMPPEDMFWGDRVGTVKDPFGHSWSFASRVKHPTAEEIEEGARVMAENMGK